MGVSNIRGQLIDPVPVSLRDTGVSRGGPWVETHGYRP